MVRCGFTVVAVVAIMMVVSVQQGVYCVRCRIYYNTLFKTRCDPNIPRLHKIFKMTSSASTSIGCCPSHKWRI